MSNIFNVVILSLKKIVLRNMWLKYDLLPIENICYLKKSDIIPRGLKKCTVVINQTPRVWTYMYF